MKDLPRQVRGQAQKELVKLFDRLAQRHSRWTVWADFVQMAAITLSNAVDKVHFEERGKSYLSIAKKYREAELDAIAEMFTLVVDGMEENPDQDFLGELFMCFFKIHPSRNRRRCLSQSSIIPRKQDN